MAIEYPSRKRCPVCGEASYSQAGIHPQCAHLRSEPLRLKRIKTRGGMALPAQPPSGGAPMSRWAKACPKCHAQLHVRKKACDCGYVFGRPVG